jgi:phosphatidylserine/phosphatidylglycerophosphate/cardiolipin synthase-like enzyme
VHAPRRAVFIFLRICASLAWLAPNAIAGSTFLANAELREALLTEIVNSRSSIDAELYKLSDRELVRALAQAGRNGVRVRILLCPAQAGNQAAAVKISEAGGEVRWFPISRPNQIMHLKAALFDSNCLWFGSANWTYWGMTLHHEAAIRTDEAGLCHSFQEMFEKDWNGASLQPPRGMQRSFSKKKSIKDHVRFGEKSLSVFTSSLI